jgi:hypothetical protein
MPDRHSSTRRRSHPPISRNAEFLFAFVRLADRAPMSCDLRFRGEQSGWEAQFLVRGELMYRCGGFTTREQAIQWAEAERKAMETGGN